MKRLLRSSTLRSAVLAALVVWAPGALLFSLYHREWTFHLLEQSLEELDEPLEDLFEFAREEQRPELEIELGEPLEMDEVEDESPASFLRRYVRRIRQEQSFRIADLGLDARLALLGESEADLTGLPVDDLVDLMLEEIPEPFHDVVEGLMDWRLEDLEEVADQTAVTTDGITGALDELELLEEPEHCIRLQTAAGKYLAASFDKVLETRLIEDRFTLLHVTGGAVEEDSDEGESSDRWCLVEERVLVDGGRLLVGQRIDERYALIRRGTTWRNLLLALGPLLALAVAWRQSRPVLRFLETLSIAARRQARGDVQARLRVSSSSPDLDLAVATVNRMLGQLEQTVQGLSRVSDSIAHDLRTPLSRLQGQLDLLRQSSSASDEIIEAVQGEADQLLETFNALLRIAQVESGSRKRGFRRLDFVEIVRNVAELYAPVFAEKDILFTLDVPDTRVDYNGDRDLWLQALSNLVENALKYTPGGGTVHLALDAGAMRPLIRLVDSGPGIPEPERENVFRRFYRLQRHRGERGNGLGLSLVGAVCELHHAEIRLGGENGLTVEIEL